MNIDAYNLDSLRGLVRQLQAENNYLRDLLREKHIPAEEGSAFQDPFDHADDYDPDQSSRILPFQVTDNVIRGFFGMFWGRMDVFAKRGSRGGYFPQSNHVRRPVTQARSQCNL